MPNHAETNNWEGMVGPILVEVVIVDGEGAGVLAAAVDNCG
jgi:hypothetical protein